MFTFGEELLMTCCNVCLGPVLVFQSEGKKRMYVCEGWLALLTSGAVHP